MPNNVCSFAVLSYCSYSFGSIIGGGGHSGDPHFGRYVPQQSESAEWGAPERLERENAGLWRGLEREIGVSGADL